DKLPRHKGWTAILHPTGARSGDDSIDTWYVTKYFECNLEEFPLRLGATFEEVSYSGYSWEATITVTDGHRTKEKTFSRLNVSTQYLIGDFILYLRKYPTGLDLTNYNI